MELKQLQFLVTCARTRSFSKAASQLFTAQSNVSKVIRSLEEELDMELFERKQYGIVLTEQGKRVYEYAIRTLENAKQIEEFAVRKNRAELRYSCNPDRRMAENFRDYYLANADKDISCYVMTASTKDIIQRLAQDVDNLGFVYIMESKLPALESLMARNHISYNILSRTRAMLYFGNPEGRQKYLEAGEGQKTVKLIQGFEDEFTLSAFWQEKTEEDESSGNAPKIAVTTNSAQVMQEMLENTDLGNIRAEEYGADDFFEDGMIPIHGDEDAVVFCCLFRNDRKLDAVHRDFLNFIRGRVEVSK